MSYLKRYLEKVEDSKKSFAAISFLSAIDHIEKTSKKVSLSILQELKDQRSFLKLIASENYSSLAVQLAMGNLLTDKYSEGVPNRRFYAGCDNVDEIENLAIEEAKDVFKCEHAYIQPHSGSDANFIAYWAVICQKVENKEIEKLQKKNVEELTDKEYEKIRKLLVNQKIMGMSLSSGGHLTHGYRRNISSKQMIAVNYGVDPKTFLIDYKALREKVKKEKPLILVTGYSSYPRLINFAKMKEIAEENNCVLMVDMAHFAGLVAGKVAKGEYDPVPYADIITSTTHKTLRGPRGGLILCKNEYKDMVDKGCPLIIGGPMPHVMAAKAIAFKEANTLEFRSYSEKVVENAKTIAETLQSLGAKVITDGTDNHMVLLDVASSFGITGRQAETVLREARITVNRNSIPEDKYGPWYASGIRIGTPAITTLNMQKEEMKIIAKAIYKVLDNARGIVLENKKLSKYRAEVDITILKEVQTEITDLLKQFPLYPELIID